MHSLKILVGSASIPELKEAIRQFEARCPWSNELSQNLSGILLFEEKNSRDGLRGVVEVCVIGLNNAGGCWRSCWVMLKMSFQGGVVFLIEVKMKNKTQREKWQGRRKSRKGSKISSPRHQKGKR
jgi:hypothetical protein